ncbi:glutathione S-transferase N-terminal domain-containing protein [Natronospira bacteriovora]|uniref:Glutathione S-transferase N-terminal domain-containing protein n=1 Tax=Natronospira bacteriovora TaxID=3069753 RepID=A0ABU0W6Z1_9GAMM|nr:glutathione S-transferase N-terminal domain-containing protein [Natronospira sp. AB-CW4]MDQ2069523.1 glutathione S-transferase N-terminal domain-containing protein [Natronospira sp. AB-CW4]
MAVVANRRSVMTLFSYPDSIESHRIRFVLSEKGINHESVLVENGQIPEDLIDLNPYQTVPTLADRDLVLHGPMVIMEYLDERFPHPPLMPVDPVGRARVRLMVYQIEQDWYRLADVIENGTPKKVENARKELTDSVVAADPMFATEALVEGEFSLADCTVAPLLWRLDRLGIKLPPRAKKVRAYCDRLFDRASFKASLTSVERERG